MTQNRSTSDHKALSNGESIQVMSDSVDPTDVQSSQRIASEMAKAFQELAKGEQTASALEKSLDGIESRIDQLLAAMEEQSKDAQSSSEIKDEKSRGE